MFTTHVPEDGKHGIVLATLESVAIFWGYIPLALRPKMATDWSFETTEFHPLEIKASFIHWIVMLPDVLMGLGAESETPYT